MGEIDFTLPPNVSAGAAKNPDLDSLSADCTSDDDVGSSPRMENFHEEGADNNVFTSISPSLFRSEDNHCYYPKKRVCSLW